MQNKERNRRYCNSGLESEFETICFDTLKILGTSTTNMKLKINRASKQQSKLQSGIYGLENRLFRLLTNDAVVSLKSEHSWGLGCGYLISIP